MTERPFPSVSAWLTALDDPSAWGEVLAKTYGRAPIEDRVRLLRRTLANIGNLHGDGPVRVFRSPGRINLRGMHVDTHGGYLNLMTHQREVVVACRPRDDDKVTVTNLDAVHPPVQFRIHDFLDAAQAIGNDWSRFIQHPVVTTIAPGWGRYVTGAILRAQWPLGGAPFIGFDAVVGSDLPMGSALSSSAALSLSVFLASAGVSHRDHDDAQRILGTRDAEWFAGARTGTSDPAAMVLGGAGLLAHAALLAEQFSLDDVHQLGFPEDEVSIVVAESNTTRQLSGAGLLAYVRNRAAYSIALEVFRQEMAGMGLPEARVAYCDRLSRIDAQSLGGSKFFAATLMRVPESLEIDALRHRYDLHEIDAVLEKYFGGIERAAWPDSLPLRGPLLFGLAESRRAQRFREAIDQRDWTLAGRLMTTGHAGDRVTDETGQPYERVVTLRELARLGDESIRLEDLPGDYGASSPVLDSLVDTAVGAGAYGASLTGAGIAGSIIAICAKDVASTVVDALIEKLASKAYAQLASFDVSVAPIEARRLVTINATTAPAGEILIL